eukprot:GFUD01139069.1.p1 GENE.GFUD01139069.1~~GFUD01139069.1.p1  ORF type:complete len:563 (-),score=86.66 GFUD01139069.1:194-1882(-)
MSLINIPAKSLALSAEFTLPEEDEQKSLTSASSKTKLTPQSVQDVIGEFGLFQKLLYFLLWFPAAAMAVGVYASVYMEYTPHYHCVPDVDPKDPSFQPVYNPTDANLTCWIHEHGEITQCSKWVFDTSVFTSTVISEFEIICASSYLKTFSTTIYMSGMLFGSFFFGWFGDKFGRKAAFAITTLSLSTGSVFTAISPNFPSYVVARFLTSCGGMGLFITTFVIALEFVGTEYRTLCGIAIEIPFALGELYIVFLAYFIRDWRTYQLVIGIPFFLFLLYLVKIPESIRWLLSKGRVAEAKKTVCEIAQFNGSEKPLWTEDICGEEEEEESLLGDEPENLGICSLLSHPILRMRTLIMALNWVVATLGYYGLSLNSARLGDPFSSFALTAAMEIPSYIFCMLFLDRFGRKSILAFSQILAGTTCILAGVIPQEPEEEMFYLRTALSLMGKFGASAGFAIVFVFTAELFPTPVRNSAVGLCSTFARIGGMLAPVVTGLAVYASSIPFIVMGSSCCIGGLTALLLPETAGKPLPDTIEEACRIGSKTEKIGVPRIEETKDKLLQSC